MRRYASAYGISFANNLTLLHRPWRNPGENILNIFSMPESITDEALPHPLVLQEQQHHQLRFEEPCLSLQQGSEYEAARPTYVLLGYRQSFRYFANDALAYSLRQNLQFRNSSLVAFAERTLASLRRGASTSTVKNQGDTKADATTAATFVVGVHVRYGMAHHPDFQGCLPPPSFYQEAMEHFRSTQRHARVIFLVAASSGGDAWFKKNVLQRERCRGQDTLFVTHFTNDAIETLAVLTRCDATIYSFGTYGWWAAWLAGGSVAYWGGLRSQRSMRMCKIVASSGVGIRDHLPATWQPIPRAGRGAGEEVSEEEHEEAQEPIVGSVFKDGAAKAEAKAIVKAADSNDDAEGGQKEEAERAEERGAEEQFSEHLICGVAMAGVVGNSIGERAWQALRDYGTSEVCSTRSHILDFSLRNVFLRGVLTLTFEALFCVLWLPFCFLLLLFYKGPERAAPLPLLRRRRRRRRHRRASRWGSRKTRPVWRGCIRRSEGASSDYCCRRNGKSSKQWERA
jgi:hypothetical protein